ncbi:hypothetical protein DL546_001345 [Coniochaeta pulveracea]|uniref:Uncharacterized protein n=1 Tax=Coniochaeta pulveracea TaxID=177199 RepID=A0A420YBA4_9PEZI|nr:hypothetical protein DL546_001345 [Coniochaeta pulveracea]
MATTFSNRTHGRKKYRVKNKVVTPASTMGSRNPYRQRTESVASSKMETPMMDQKGKESQPVEEYSDPPSVLVDMLKAASAQSRAQSDFVSAHLYWRTLQQLESLSSESLRQNDFATLLSIFSRGPRDLINRSNAAIEEYEAWLVWLKQSQERAEGLIDSMMRRFRALRDKMWYVTDVRNSGPYMDSRNIAVALKTMGMPRKWRNFQQTHRYMQRSGAANFLFRTESQALELLAASEDQGGPNKLSDEQADTTARWLQHSDIQNFCRGEERIHRFTLEIDLCINKLVGPNIVDTPVLWSSDLFVRDRRALEDSSKGTRHKDNSGYAWEDSVSINSDPERRYGSLGRSSGKSVNLRNLSTHNFSQTSFDSGRHSFSRASTALSDSHEYFGMTSPVQALDPSSTFWSPFQAAVSTGQISRAQSPNSSVTNLSSVFSHPQQPSHMSTGRPGTSASSNETVYQQRLSDEKTRFLSELRQTLTSLLLSDLGNLVFARGSETDTWFDGLGQECIDRREATRRRAQKETRRSSRANPTQRVVERRRSFGNLRGVGGSDFGDKVASDTQSQSRGSDVAGSQGNDSSATSDTLRLSQQPAKKDTAPDFPFTKAYQRLLRMFCVHPNPYAKLNALYELEHLIVASLNSGSKRSRLAWARSEGSASSATGDHSVAGRSKPLEDAIDNVRERRSHAMANHPTIPSAGYAGRPSGALRDAETRSVMTVNNANTDIISNILQALFRDASIRPKTLFRDLQYIAALVPPSTLDQERAKAFWDTSLAALLLKQEVCRTMVEVADDVVKLYTSARGSASLLAAQQGNSAHLRSSSTSTADSTERAPTSSSGGHGDSSTTITVPSSAASSPALPSPLPLTTYSLADAGRMWAIAAKEGDPSAQRELGLFYLGYPELVERATLPLSKPREVFKQAVMEKYGGGRSGFGPQSGLGLSLGGGGGSRGRDAPPGGDVRSDPALMCVAIHWMKEAAERGNDELARQFLCQDGIVGL